MKATLVYDSASQFNETYGSFWATQPVEVFTLDTFPDDLLPLLQSQELTSVVQNHVKSGLDAYKALLRTQPGLLSWEQYSHLAAIVTSRSFLFALDDEDDETDSVLLVPAADMLNCRLPFNVR